MATSRFASRSSDVEIMDDLACSGEVVHQTLRELEFINRTLGGNSITIDGVQQLVRKRTGGNLEILDLGCGGGDMLMLLKRKLSEQFPKLKLHGIDANPNIIQYAIEHCSRDIQFSALNIFSDEFRKINCDIAIATLFLHHFSFDQLVDIMKQLKIQCRVGIVINDLHRNPVAFYSIKILARLFSKSNMVKFDAPLSVLRGFSKSEWTAMLKEAAIENYTLKWRWAFRWQVVISCPY